MPSCLQPVWRSNTTGLKRAICPSSIAGFRPSLLCWKVWIAEKKGFGSDRLLTTPLQFVTQIDGEITARGGLSVSEFDAWQHNLLVSCDAHVLSCLVLWFNKSSALRISNLPKKKKRRLLAPGFFCQAACNFSPVCTRVFPENLGRGFPLASAVYDLRPAPGPESLTF